MAHYFKSPLSVFAGLCALLILAFGPHAVEAGLTSQEIDALLEKKLTVLEITPSDTVSDSEFLRRLSLDVRGVTPSMDEASSFLRNDSPTKRTDLVEAFLMSEERGEHWATYWDKILVGQLQNVGPQAQYIIKTAWREWLIDVFNENLPYDEFMEEIVTSSGRTDEDPELLAIARWRQEPANMAGNMSRAFLGIQIQCAQCHDHKDNPELTQEKFWEFTSFFNNTRIFPIQDQDMMEDRVPGRQFHVMTAGMRFESVIPESDPPVSVKPTYLDGTVAKQEIVGEDGQRLDRKTARTALQEGRAILAELNKMRRSGNESPEDRIALVNRYRNEMPYLHDTRRDQLAEIILKKDAEQFAKNFVNRTWARFFGRGILHPVDSWETGIEPTHPELLDALAHEFIMSGYDVRHLERLILNTNAYARSSKPTNTSRSYPEYFAHAQVRPLAPEQLLASLIQATNAEALSRAENRRRTDEQMERLRSVYTGQFVFAFGNDEMEWSSHFETSVPRALFMMNDKAINDAIANSNGGTVDRIMKNETQPDEMMAYAYLATLGRMPTEPELAMYRDELQLKHPGDRKKAMEDLLWALMNSTEFLTNH